MNERKTTNTLLLFIVIPLIFYLLKILSFIFIPLVLSMFLALLFIPLMRWLTSKKVPKPLGIIIVVAIIGVIIKIGAELIKLTSKEILSRDSTFFEEAEMKLTQLVLSVEDFLGIQRIGDENVLLHYLQTNDLMSNFGSTLNLVGDTLTMILMTIFFMVLLLSESINFQKILDTTIFRRTYSSVKTFRRIEKDIIKFVKVKFLVSLFTGIGFTLACLAFDVSFPIFWGLFAFAINFVQMVGSIISIICLSVFAFVELDPSSTLLIFILIITGVQILFGSILEPIFMGKTFSLNVITVLVMLMLWGYIWGIPGLIMSIPITVFIKIILEQFPNTRPIAEIMSGSKELAEAKQI